MENETSTFAKVLICSAGVLMFLLVSVCLCAALVPFWG